MSAEQNISQGQFFDPGPESPVMWHLNRSPRGSGQLDLTRDRPTHLGTQRAALERGYGDELQGVVPNPMTMHAVRVDGEQMLNDQARPISDPMANTMESSFTDEPGPVAFTPSREEANDFVRQTDRGPHDQEFAEDILTNRKEVPDPPVGSRFVPTKGAYYENNVEDEGSVSAVAPSSAVTPLATFETRHAPFDIEEPEERRTVFAAASVAGGKTIHKQPRLFDVSQYDKRTLPRQEFRHGGPEVRRTR